MSTFVDVQAGDPKTPPEIGQLNGLYEPDVAMNNATRPIIESDATSKCSYASP